jgi:hypothetical protein
MEDANAYILGQVRWQLFASLTYYDARRPHFVPNEDVLCKIGFVWWRAIADQWKTPRKKLLWALRFESGEQTGRRHLHALLAGLPDGGLTKSARFIAMAKWRAIAGGFARVRPFGRNESTDYILKPDDLYGADAYESGKFSRACRIEISHSVWSFLAARRGLGIKGKVYGVRERHGLSERDLRGIPRGNALAHPYDLRTGESPRLDSILSN